MAHTGGGPGSSRWVGYARDGVEVIWAVPHGLLRQLAAVAHCGEAAPGKLGDDASDPAFIFAEPRVGYRMEKGGSRNGGHHNPARGRTLR